MFFSDGKASETQPPDRNTPTRAPRGALVSRARECSRPFASFAGLGARRPRPSLRTPRVIAAERPPKRRPERREKRAASRRSGSAPGPPGDAGKGPARAAASAGPIPSRARARGATPPHARRSRRTDAIPADATPPSRGVKAAERARTRTLSRWKPPVVAGGVASGGSAADARDEPRPARKRRRPPSLAPEIRPPRERYALQWIYTGRERTLRAPGCLDERGLASHKRGPDGGRARARGRADAGEGEGQGRRERGGGKGGGEAKEGTRAPLEGRGLRGGGLNDPASRGGLAEGGARPVRRGARTADAPETRRGRPAPRAPARACARGVVQSPLDERAARLRPREKPLGAACRPHLRRPSHPTRQASTGGGGNWPFRFSASANAASASAAPARVRACSHRHRSGLRS